MIVGFVGKEDSYKATSQLYKSCSTAVFSSLEANAKTLKLNLVPPFKTNQQKIKSIINHRFDNDVMYYH
jgi:hypothetical protein